MTTNTQKPLVRVILWRGTEQVERHASTYEEVKALIDCEHRNAHDPKFYEIATGRQIYDDGSGLCLEDRGYYVV
jgi:hypothetical protein